VREAARRFLPEGINDDADRASPGGADVFPAVEISTDAWQPLLPRGGPVRQQWLDVNGALVAAGGADRDGWWMHWPHLATFTFAASGGVMAHASSGSSRETIIDSYTRGVLPVVLLAREHEALHASGVLYRGGVTAFCAPSGTGKSSLALAIAAAGGGHWADDTVVLCTTAGRLEAVSLPFPARVDADVRGALGDTVGGVRTVSAGTRAPLRRVYLLVRDPAVDPRSPQFTEIEGGERFERLLAHAHPFDLSSANRRRRMIERLMQAAVSVSVCELRFGPSLAALPVLAARVAEHIAHAGA